MCCKDIYPSIQCSAGGVLDVHSKGLVAVHFLKLTCQLNSKLSYLSPVEDFVHRH